MFNLQRDVAFFVQKDIRQSLPSDQTSEGNSIEFLKGIEVGHIFQLGSKYAKTMNASVLDQQGKAVFH